MTAMPASASAAGIGISCSVELGCMKIDRFGPRSRTKQLALEMNGSGRAGEAVSLRCLGCIGEGHKQRDGIQIAIFSSGHGLTCYLQSKILPSVTFARRPAAEAVRLLRLVHHATLEYYLVEAESQSRKASAAKNE
jgi:hypothetical protein